METEILQEFTKVDLFCIAVAKELGNSKKFRDYINRTNKKHIELVNEFGKGGEEDRFPVWHGYLRVNKDIVAGWLSAYGETLYGWNVFPYMFDDLTDDDACTIASFMVDELNKYDDMHVVLLEDELWYDLDVFCASHEYG